MTKYIYLLVVAAGLVFPVSAYTQNWPERPVRLVVPYPAGGNADVVGRIVAQALQEKLQQPFIVDNRAGAGGVIGGTAVANAAPDGYTFLFSANGPILFAPELVQQRPYEWRTSFVPVSTVSLTPLVLLVNPTVPVKNFAEFLSYARRQGDKLTYAAGGLGTINHLFSEHMQAQLKLGWTTIQYKGTAPAMTDLIAGHVPFGIDQVSAAGPVIKEGRVRALAVTGEKRSSVLPEVPTLVELGYKDLTGYTFTALMAPAGTPNDIVAKLHASLAAVLKDPKVVEKLQALGAEAETMSPDEFKKFLEREDMTWIPIVRRLNPK